MIAPLLLGVIAFYMIIGWIVIAALDRRIGRTRRRGGLWVAMIFWPITVVIDVLTRGANR